MSNAGSISQRRSVISLYFLISSVPWGLFALFGNFMFFQSIKEEFFNLNRRPHDFRSLMPYFFALLYMAIIDAGFFLLPGYAKSTKMDYADASGNTFWKVSAIYNVLIGASNGYFIHATAPATFFLNPAEFPFWMVGVPTLGLLLSLWCLRVTKSRAV